MTDLPVLVVGDKNLSSWSLRPWLALRHAGIPFTEELVRLNRPDTAAAIAARSPTGRVPVLRLGGRAIAESIAICEWAAEQAPILWPDDPLDRAEARSVSAEMHAGFAELRREYPMNVEGRTPKAPSATCRAQIDRVLAMWSSLRAAHADGGPFLFGRFTIADCMYAPVVTRLRTYGVALDHVAARYSEAVFAHPAMREWCEAAAAETRG